MNLINLTASDPGLLPSGSIAFHPTWRPDGSGVLFSTMLNPGSRQSEDVIGEIDFGSANAGGSGGCPDAATLANSTFKILAGGGKKRGSPRLNVPTYWRNAPIN